MSLIIQITGASTIDNYYDPTDQGPNFSSLSVSAASSNHLSISGSYQGMSFTLEIGGTFPALGTPATFGDYIASSSTVSSLALTTPDGVLTLTFDQPTSLQLAVTNLAGNNSSALQQMFSNDDDFISSLNTNTDNSNDHVLGYSGNDRFTGNSTSGNSADFFDGGDGIDTAVFRGNAQDYTISSSFTTVNPDGVNVYSGPVTAVQDSVSARDGLKNLVDVERLEFSDKGLAFDTDGASSAGGIYRLYQATFDRVPDHGGLGYWIEQADNGESGVRMAEDFTWSQEFQQLYGVTTHDNYQTGANISALVTGFYQHVLHRAPDQGGLDFYTNEITTHHKTVGQVLAEVSDSPENYAATIGQIQQGIEYTPWHA